MTPTTSGTASPPGERRRGRPAGWRRRRGRPDRRDRPDGAAADASRPDAAADHGRRRERRGFGCLFGAALPRSSPGRSSRRIGVSSSSQPRAGARASSRSSSSWPSWSGSAGRCSVTGRDARPAGRGDAPGRGRRLHRPGRRRRCRAGCRSVARSWPTGFDTMTAAARDRRAPAPDPARRRQPRAADAADRRPGQPRGDRRRRLPGRPGAPRRRSSTRRASSAGSSTTCGRSPCPRPARWPSTPSRPTPTSWSPRSSARSSRPPRPRASTLAAAIDGDLPILEIDPVRIREVLANLVANALAPHAGRAAG